MYRWMLCLALFLILLSPATAADSGSNGGIGDSIFGTVENGGMSWTFIDLKMLGGDRKSEPSGLFSDYIELGPIRINYVDNILVFGMGAGDDTKKNDKNNDQNSNDDSGDTDDQTDEGSEGSNDEDSSDTDDTSESDTNSDQTQNTDDTSSQQDTNDQ